MNRSAAVYEPLNYLSDDSAQRRHQLMNLMSELNPCDADYHYRRQYYGGIRGVHWPLMSEADRKIVHDAELGLAKRITAMMAV